MPGEPHEPPALPLIHFFHTSPQPDQPDLLGRTPLHCAVLQGSRRVVKYLLEQMGAEVEAREKLLGWSCLHIAAFTANTEVRSLHCPS